MADNPYSGADSIIGNIEPGTDIAKMLAGPSFAKDKKVIVCYEQAFPPLSGELWVRTASGWKQYTEGKEAADG